MGQTLGGQDINVSKLVLAFAEVLYFDPALLHQCLDAVIHPTGANAQRLSQLSLGDIGGGLQQAQHPIGGVLLMAASEPDHSSKIDLCSLTLPPHPVSFNGRSLFESERLYFGQVSARFLA
jgi:hypothetical protein